MSESSQLVRQWKVRQLLEATRRGCTVPEPAAETEVSDKTIRRDLKVPQTLFDITETKRDGGVKRWQMDCVCDETGSSDSDPFLTGHYRDGAPVKSGDRRHIAVAGDLELSSLFVFPPSALGRGETHDVPWLLKQLEASLRKLHVVRSGRNGTLLVRRVTVEETSDAPFVSSRIWSTVTPYAVNRHARNTTAAAVVERDVLMECERRGLPRPEIKVVSGASGCGAGLDFICEFNGKQFAIAARRVELSKPLPAGHLLLAAFFDFQSRC